MAYDEFHFTCIFLKNQQPFIHKTNMWVGLNLKLFAQLWHGIHHVKKVAKRYFYQKSGGDQKLLYFRNCKQCIHYQLINNHYI